MTVAAFAAMALADSTWIKGSTGGWASDSSWEGGKPTSGSTVIVPPDCDMPVTDADMAIAANVAEIKTSAEDSRVVFNLNTDATYNGKVTGDGYFVKEGSGNLSLVYIDQTAFKTKGGVVVNAGKLTAPKNLSGWKKVEFGNLHVAEGAVFDACSKQCTTYIARLSGKGEVQNSTTGGYWTTVIDSTSSFEGAITGYLNLTVSAKVDLLGTKNSFMGTMTFSGPRSDVGGKIFGWGTLTDTSIGRCKTGSTVREITFESNAGRLRYLGTGESCERVFNFGDSPAVIDGGTNGNLVLKGTFKRGTQPRTVTFSGSNAAPCTVSGTWTEGENSETYIKKSGPGTWIFRGNENLNFKGVVGVEEGTFAFDSLADVGTPCSFGLSTMLAKDYFGTELYDAIPKADYAILLGSADHEGAIEYVGNCYRANVATNRPVAVTGKGGRIKVDGANRMVSFTGAFAADEDGATLTLDGTAPISYLYDATDRHGPLSISKEGSGTWYLGGDQTFSGKLDVKEGELVVSSTLGTRYNWYRFTVRETWAVPRAVTSYSPWRCREFVLNAENGGRLNGGLVEVSTNSVPAPGQITVWQDDPFYDSNRTAGPNQLVDGFVNWSKDRIYTTAIQCGGTCPHADRPETWIPVVMHLPHDAAQAKYYDGLASDNAGNACEAYSFTMEASADGVTWDLVSDVASNAVAFSSQNWWTSTATSKIYDTNAGHKGFAFGLDEGKSLRTTDPTQDFGAAGVSVAAGAVLKAEGAVTLKALEVDATGAGTVDGFAFAANGTINVTGSAGPGDIELPLTLSNVQGTPDFSGWSVKMGGTLRRSRKVEYKNGKLTVLGVGLSVIVR